MTIGDGSCGPSGGARSDHRLVGVPLFGGDTTRPDTCQRLRRNPHLSAVASSRPARVMLQARAAWAPRVLRCDGGPLRAVRVASAFADRVCELVIFEADLAVLRGNERGHRFLFAAQHTYQLMVSHLHDAALTSNRRAPIHSALAHRLSAW